MKKVAVMLVLSLVFVAAMPVMSFAIPFGPDTVSANAVSKREEWKKLPDGTVVKETKTVVEPSTSGAKAGAAAGIAAGGMIAGPVGAAVGGAIGGLIGLIWGPAD